MRRLAYLAALTGCALWYLTFGRWLAWVMLLGLLLLPVLSLAISARAVLDFQIAPVGPERAEAGQKTEYMLLGSCAHPMPPFRGMICLRELRTGRKLRYREEQGFVPLHCGGYQLTVEKARVLDYLELFSFPVRAKKTAKLLVRPQPVPIENLPDFLDLPPVRWKAGGRLGENHELRPYRPGDSMNTVHWKLTAKVGKLMVREAMEPVHRKACLTLSLAGTPEALDTRLGNLLWLGEKLLQAGLEPEILAAAKEGTVRFSVKDLSGLTEAVDGLLSLPAPSEETLPEPIAASWHYCLGGGS